ncbi:MAG: helix-turn-helix domain-containing protein [Pseudomonadales bacterium]|nr:helix-turn-helix domain-containing protein [Pseudomonadales bacterium]
MSKQHANATTTPEMRAFIRESDLPTAVLARLLKISESTVRKWRKRESINDESNTPKQLNTTLTLAQEYVVVELRQRLLLSLDELLAVCREFINPCVSRAGLQRCLKRNGVSRLVDLDEDGETDDGNNPIQVAIEDKDAQESLLPDVTPESMREVLNRHSNISSDVSADIGPDEMVQVKVTQLPDFEGEKTQRRLLIANDPASGWVYVDIYDGDEKEAASRYMSHVLTKAPFHIRRILAGNYNEFLSRFRLLDDAAVTGSDSVADDEDADKS